MSNYTDKLEQLVNIANSIPGTGGQRALRKIILDLGGSGPISELIYTLDEKNFRLAIELLMEFKRTGKRESFNQIHRDAADSLA